MRAIIIGAGNAGRNLATKLCDEKHDVVVVDKNPDALEYVGAHLDILTCEGHGSSPDILEQAGIDKADLVVGVTNNDDLNIMVCTIASRAGVRYKVARLSNTEYLRRRPFFNLQEMGVDLAINPKHECAEDIRHVLRMPGANEIIDMMDGRIFAMGFVVPPDSPLVGIKLIDFPNPDMLATIRFMAIMREGHLIIPYGNAVFEKNDEVYVVGRPEDVQRFLNWCQPERQTLRKIVIAGGGDLGAALAARLEQEFETVLIESNSARAEQCAAMLNKTLIIQGNTLEKETLQNCGFTEETAFIAATGDDENNIIGCLLAQKHGAEYTVAQVTDPEYVPIIDSLNLLDRAVSMHLSTINSILHFIRGKNVRAASLLQSLPGELLEVDLSGTSRWTEKKISQLRLPPGVIIAAVRRGEDVFVATGELQLQADDCLVIFSTPNMVAKLKKICSE